MVESFSESMKHTVKKLKGEGEKNFILSGDNKSIVEKVVIDLGVENFYAQLKFPDKLEIIKELNKKYKY